jgi:hypothetical protein
MFKTCFTKRDSNQTYYRHPLFYATVFKRMPKSSGAVVTFTNDEHRVTVIIKRSEFAQLLKKSFRKELHKPENKNAENPLFYQKKLANSQKDL